MKTILALGVFGSIVVAMLTEALNIVMTFRAMEHVASYNAWLTM